MYHIRPKPRVPPKVKRDFRPKTETESQSYRSRHDYRSQQVPPSVRCPTLPYIWYLSHLAHEPLCLAPSCQPCSVSLMTRSQGPTVPDADADNAAASSVYTVRLMAPHVWRTLASATQALWPTFGNHRIYQLQPAETKSAPNVIRLLSAETECPPKVPIYPHSAPKPKTKPKFGRPLMTSFGDALCVCFTAYRHWKTRWMLFKWKSKSKVKHFGRLLIVVIQLLRNATTCLLDT